MSELNFTLERKIARDSGVFGRLTGEGLSLHTLERPWLDNRENVSCIPPGVYKVVHHSTKDYPNHYRLLNVPGRSGILIHEGNTLKDTIGCILVGQKTGKLGEQDAVLESVLALNQLRAKVGKSGFTLSIIDKTAEGGA